ncbi:hypothetical protein EGW08_017957 [Elysia chlorotica]|uniref:Carbohydrate sulfotransferase n=1 Tax=Elysia chlorotica TaxID=188477 RepID=A0A433SY84_ELYCH|nr:hypothetical protein EGW08_017957 [Elysia chlorotica]
MRIHLRHTLLVCTSAVCVTLVLLYSHVHPDITITMPSGLRRAYLGFLRPRSASLDMASLEKLFKQRRENARIECKKHPVVSPGLNDHITTNMFYDNNTNSLYCAVPKIGSSLWKRLFLIAHSNKTKDPLSMSGLQIHMNYDLLDLSFVLIPEEVRPEVAKGAFTFMFARNPFHRIFSAYCDKLFMLAYETSRIISYVRYIIENTVDLAINGTTKSFVYTGPELNLSFADALAHAAKSEDPHFVRISNQCNPCDIDFHVLGRMESMDTDSRYVLAKLNRSHIMENKMETDAFKMSRDQSTIRELVQRSFKVMKGEFDEMSKFKALVRTWKVFHIRGIISDEIPYPISISETKQVNASSFIELGIRAMNNSGSPAKRYAQREKYYHLAFRSVPLSVIKSFSRSVLRDCSLFGYDCYPKEIYSGRRDGDEEDNLFSNDKYLYKGLL